MCNLYAGLTLFGLRNVGGVLTGPNSQVEFSESAALLFGTICAAVDPVAVSILHTVSILRLDIGHSIVKLLVIEYHHLFTLLVSSLLGPCCI
jgi:hypothetical protein